MKFIPTTATDLVIPSGGVTTLVYGFRGTGKTTFLVDTADVAQPLFFAGFDRSAERHLAKYQGKEFYREYFKPQQTQAGAEAEWRRFRSFVDFAIRHESGVFAIDNQLGMHELARKTFLPDKLKEDKIYPKEFGDVNSGERGVFKDLEDSGLYTVVSATAAEIWQGMATGSGKFDYEGWKYLDSHCINVVRIYVVGKPIGSDLQPRENSSKLVYQGWIEDAKFNPPVCGAVITNPRLSDVLKVTQ